MILFPHTCLTFLVHLPSDVVNTAARLAGYAHKKGIKVVCGEDYKREMQRMPRPAHILFEDIGMVTLKGKLSDLRVFNLKTGVGPQSPSIEMNHQIVVGREDDVARMLKFVKNVEATASGMMLVMGPSGIGKSALLHHLGTVLLSPAGTELAGPAVAHAEAPKPPIVIRMQLIPQQKSQFFHCYILLESVLRSCGEVQAHAFSALEVSVTLPCGACHACHVVSQPPLSDLIVLLHVSM